MQTINYYNKVKEIIIKSSEELPYPAALHNEVPGGHLTIKMFNIRVFYAMLKELRIKLDIYKMGLGPPKTKRIIAQGLLGNDKRSRKIKNERIE